MNMTEPKRIGVSIELKPHAYDPAVNPELFEGVPARRIVAFLIDLCIISIPVVVAAIFIFAVGIVTFGLGFLFYALLPPAVVVWALAYYGLTFGSPSSATIGMRIMDLEMRTWYGAPCLFRARRRPCHRVLDFGFDAHPLHPARVPLQRSPPAAARHAGRHHRHQQRAQGERAARRYRASKPFDESRRARDSAARPGGCPAGGARHVTRHSRDTPQFYLTAPSPCPYLPGREERKVFTHLVGERAGELNDLLTHGGFRRSQSIAYRPACETCRSCVSVRVVAADFRPTRSMRRIAERNAGIVGEMRPPVPTSEQYGVFRGYLDTRHRDGGMADMTVLDFAMMVEDSHVQTRLVEYRRRGPDTGFNGRGRGRCWRSRSPTC